ncbi:hypothetical protein SAMN05519104_8004 [Rhizobiales bacterium GAS188]|nr:hypothetical protein SAMN05519104_8004 [Rhizobiales bacterium GAS188]
MRWRVMVELTGQDGTVRTHEVSAGGNTTTEHSSAAIGLTLADGKRTLAGLQDDLVRAQTGEYCRGRRRCPRCGSQRPLKDAHPAAVVAVWNGGGSRAALFALSVCGDEPSHAQPGRRDHARPMHARIRAPDCEDGLASTLSPCPDVARGVPATRGRPGGRDDPPPHHTRGGQTGKVGYDPTAACRRTSWSENPA